MDKSLESLLVFGCLELEGSSKEIVIDAFSETMEYFLRHKELFEELPEMVIKTSESLKEIEDTADSTVGLAKDLITNFGANRDETIKHFKERALMLYDGLHASAFGRMSYIYRSKGIRLYLFDSGRLHLITPYCTIDHNGFELRNEIGNSFGPNFAEMSVEDVREIIYYTSEDFNIDDPNQFVSGELLKMLCSINIPFQKAYYLEYLLRPQDVNKLSEFSLKVQENLWNICLSNEFKSKWGIEIQHTAMNILSSIGVPPSTGQIVDYIKSLSSDDVTLEDIMKRLDELETNIVKANSSEALDIVDLKPNFFGLGINFNELYKRLKANN